MRQLARSVGFVSAAMAMVAIPLPALAQTSAEETVPLEFVQVLSGAPFGTSGTPGVLVGRLPDRTAAVLPLPADARIVGSLVSPPYSVSALAVPGDRGAVRDDWTERLLETGWTRYEHPSRGGFESSPVEGLQFCMGDSVTLNLGVRENPRGGSYVTVMHPSASRYSICEQRERSGFMRERESLIPSLAPPAGAIAVGSGSGGGSDEWHARARIDTDLTVDQLVDHYGSQLREAGWDAQSRTAAPGVAVESYTVTDPEGAAWHGVLVASTPGGESDREAFLRLTRVERRY